MYCVSLLTGELFLYCGWNLTKYQICPSGDMRIPFAIRVVEIFSTKEEFEDDVFTKEFHSVR